MEIVHKVNPDEYKTLDAKKFTLGINGRNNRHPSSLICVVVVLTWTNFSGRKALTLEEAQKLGGSYNVFLQTGLPENFRVYNPANETAESSQKVFTTTFARGFAVEILQVYSGPPVIVYKFRHWGFIDRKSVV